MPSPSDTTGRLFTLGVGLADAATGVGLMLAPAATVALFGAALPAGDPISMRFVGAFVCSVGMSCLWAATTAGPARRAQRIAAAWAITAIVRSIVALFIAVAVIGDHLALAWSLVGTTDAAIAIAQIVMLRHAKNPRP